MNYAEAKEMLREAQRRPSLVSQIVPSPYTLAYDDTIRHIVACVVGREGGRERGLRVWRRRPRKHRDPRRGELNPQDHARSGAGAARRRGRATLSRAGLGSWAG